MNPFKWIYDNTHITATIIIASASLAAGAFGFFHRIEEQNKASFSAYEKITGNPKNLTYAEYRVLSISGRHLPGECE